LIFFLDLAKAFDKANQRLLEKLKKHGIGAKFSAVIVGYKIQGRGERIKLDHCL